MPLDDIRTVDEIWRWFLTGNGRLSARHELELSIETKLWSLLPGNPRCLICKVPFGSPGKYLSKPLGRRPASFSPRICNSCEGMVRNRSGGAQVDLTMLFADIRGSTVLSDEMTPPEFRDLVNRFYQVGSAIIVANDGMVNRLMGDQIIGLFVPRFAGPDHAKIAARAAEDLLVATGHQDRDGPWVPVGIGIHSAEAYVGAVGVRDGINEIAVLGKHANLAARLSSVAAVGEVVLSESAARLAETAGMATQRELRVKGFDAKLSVYAVRVLPQEPWPDPSP